MQRIPISTLRPILRPPAGTPRPALAASLLLPLLLLLLLVGCTSADDADDEALEGAVATAEAQGIEVDREAMSDFPCHRMSDPDGDRDIIMGDCSSEDVERFADEILDRRGGAVAAIAGADAPEGNAAAEANADEIAERLSAEDDLVDALADEGLTVDLKAMADLPCHAMFDIVMGDCTDDDIVRVASEVLAMREPGASSSTRAQREPDAGFAPGEHDEDLRPVARQPMQVLDLADGARISMDAQLVTWEVDGQEVTGYGYNGQIPGPLLKVEQGSTITVDFRNRIDMPTTIHWHGLRHDNAHDGVPGLTQPAIQPGGSWQYKVHFPDAGPYWYHPHVREDIQQDAGMAGMMLVEPEREGYYRPVHREEVLIVDDVLIEDERIVRFGAEHANFAIMGRFGNKLLLNGESDFQLDVKRGEVVRFHIANVANVRPFALSFDGAPMRLIGSDMGKYAVERLVDEVIIAPAERYTVEVLFDEARTYDIVHDTPERKYVVGRIAVGSERVVDTAPAIAFAKTRVNSDVIQDVEQFRAWFDSPPDAVVEIDVRVPGLVMEGRLPGDEDAQEDEDHDEEGKGEEDADHDADKEDADHAEDDKHVGGLEWEDDMLAANRQALGEVDVEWIIRDRATGAENHALAYAYETGDVVKMRWVNLEDSVHPMQHPIHLHGQRFVVLATDGVPNENPVWKDVFLIPIGATVDILMEVTNPGAWMVHCHIAEHLETGMMYQFIVTPNQRG